MGKEGQVGLADTPVRARRAGVSDFVGELGG